MVVSKVAGRRTLHLRTSLLGQFRQLASLSCLKDFLGWRATDRAGISESGQAISCDDFARGTDGDKMKWRH